MNGGALPLALLCAAWGLALAFSPRSAWCRSLTAFALTAAATALAPFPSGCVENIFLGCWISVAASAASVHLPRGLDCRWALVLSINAGIWFGAMATIAGSPFDLLEGLTGLLVVYPVAWMVRRNASIVIKVFASWLIAVAVLVAALQFLPVTPGYMPDHTE